MSMRHENGINVCLVQRLKFLLPFDLVAHILITRWSVVALFLGVSGTESSPLFILTETDEGSAPLCQVYNGH